MGEQNRPTRWHKRFEVVLRSSGERVDGIMTNISNEGMEVRTKKRLEINDELSVRVVTSLGEIFHYLSQVRWWRPARGREMIKGLFRYGLKHMAVDPGHGRLVDMVKYDDSRRSKGRRVFTNLPVIIESDPSLGPVESENISVGGIFLHIDELPPPFRNDKLSLSIDLKDDANPLQADAKVVHLLQADSAKKLDLKPGIGLKFLNLSEDEKKRLLEFLEETRNKKKKKKQ